MASVIKAGNATDGVQVTSDNTGILELKTGTGAGTTAVTIGTDQSVTFAGAVSSSGNQTVTGNLTVNGNTTLGDANTDTILMTAAPSIGGAGLGMGFGFRNRIINGAMVIDQRNAGASVTPSTGTYTVDRWRIYASQSSKLTAQQNAGSVTPPAGYTNYLGMTSSSAYSIISSDLFILQQFVEGYNSADLAWGTASAASITLSFWVRSSLTGIFGINLQSSDGLSIYSTTYTVNASNTWEQKTVTIAGPTSGTWLTTNGKGIVLNFIIGIGSNGTPPANNAWQYGTNYYGAVGAQSLLATNGATLYITGVQLEKGSTATSFDYRPYGTELMLCQRYFQSWGGTALYERFCLAQAHSTTLAYGQIPMFVPMRAAPSVGSVGALGAVTATGGVNSATVAVDQAGLTSVSVGITTTGLVAGNATQFLANNSTASRFQLSAEL